MSASAFTPGPWHADLRETFRIRESDGSSIAYTQFVHLNGRRDTEEVAANAHLIAAAPDLYIALGDLVDWLVLNQRSIEGEFDMDELLSDGRAALAKAREQHP